MPAEWKIHNAEIARAVKHGDHEAADAARRAMRAARLADAIRSTMDKRPALTTEQCRSLAALLVPTDEVTV